MASDFTNPDVLLSYLSSFWTQAFGDPQAIRGIVAGDSIQLSQLQEEFLELLKSASISDVSPLHKELIYPIFIRQSTMSIGPNPLRYGDGEVYGAQPADGTMVEGKIFNYGDPEKLSPAWYHAIDPSIRNVTGTIVNSLYSPTIHWVSGNEFYINEGSIVFQSNPFDNSLFARRVVPSTIDSTIPDQEICLLAFNVLIERDDLHSRYGYAFFSNPPGIFGEPYRVLLQSIMRLYSGGPTIAALDAFFAAACSVPITKEAQETVETITVQPDLSQFVITDRNIYPIPLGMELRPTVAVGTILSAASPLTLATEVWDNKTAPDRIYSQNGLSISKNFLPTNLGIETGIGFQNDPVAVDSGADIATNDGPRRSGRFALVGLPDDLNKFWNSVQSRSADLGIYFADKLWRQRGAVDESGEPDYSRSVFINPLNFLFSNFLDDGVIGVSLSVPPTAALLASIRHLRETLPANRSIVIFVTPGYSDGFAITVTQNDPTVCGSNDEKKILHNNFSQTDSTILNSFDGSDPVANLVGENQAPDLLVDTINFGDNSVANHTVRPTSFPDCGISY